MASGLSYWDEIVLEYRKDPTLNDWLSETEAASLENIREATLDLWREVTLYQGFDILRILKKARQNYLANNTSTGKLEEKMDVMVGKEKKTFTYTNQESMATDLQFLFFVFAARGCSYMKIIEKSNQSTARVLEWIVQKLDVDINTRESGKSLGPDVITIPRLTACFPTVFCGIYNQRRAKEVVTMAAAGIPDGLTHALVCPMLVSCIPPSCIEIGSNIHMILFHVHVALDDIIHKKDKDITPLENLLAYYKAAYGSVAVPDSSRFKYMESLGLLVTGQRIFIQALKALVPESEGKIRISRVADPNLESVLSEIRQLKQKP